MITFAAPAVLSLALVAGLAARVDTAAPAAPQTSSAPRCDLATELVSDPDPMDCPFCGGEPGLHVRALWGAQRTVALAWRMTLL